jgi:hypothetical protein
LIPRWYQGMETPFSIQSTSSYNLKAYGSRNNHTRRLTEIPSTVNGEDLSDFAQAAQSLPKAMAKKFGKMLGISHGTLQNLRIKNLIPYQKIGALMFYKYGDIIKLLVGDKRSEIYR